MSLVERAAQPVIKQTRSAARCIIGPGALSEVGSFAAQFGTTALVIGGTRAVEAVRPALFASLADHHVTCAVESGEHVQKTRASADALVAVGRAHHAASVISCGGGTVMDCGKAVARELKVPLINVPTMASTNACGTVGYRLEGDVAPPAARAAVTPTVIVADTAVIARAGGRFLASGMGDALSAWYGAQLARRRGAADVSATRFAMARLCTETILADGASAYRDCSEGIATAAVDRVVEAIVYCSGVSQFGMSGDHFLHPAEIARCRRTAIHGEFVAFGLLVRLVLGGEFPDAVPELITFCRSVDLPTRFADFRLDDPSEEELLAEAQRIVSASRDADFGTGRRVTPAAIVGAMREVDAAARAAP